MGPFLAVTVTRGYSSFQTPEAKCPLETPTSNASDTLSRNLGSVGEERGGNSFSQCGH